LSSTASSASSWLGLGPASRLLGISPATLRRWSDAGRIKAYTTPGGHRRFSRTAVEAMLPAERTRRPSMELLGETPDRVWRLLGAHRQGSSSRAPWLPEIDEQQRIEFRAQGRSLATALLAYLDASSSREDRLRLEACELAAGEYGRVAASAGLSLAEAVEAFLRFRGPFMAEMAGLSRRQRLDTIEATELLQKAEVALDRLLLATMRTHARANASREQDQ
jgi:excisionase family DNA binding protein